MSYERLSSVDGGERLRSHEGLFSLEGDEKL